MKPRGHLWVILLAAGDGKRVRLLTHTCDGTPAPKQFCSLGGRESLLRRTIQRAAALVPMARIVTVVAAKHHRWWHKELSDCPTENIVVQPLNRGTAAGLLLPLLRIVRRDPLARIVVLPSDHYVASEGILLDSIETAIRAVLSNEDRVVLLGMTPPEADTQYGWIVPATGNRIVEEITAFVEKPDRAHARFLQRRGALLNTFILVATGRTLLQLYDHTAPRMVGDFVTWRDEAFGNAGALERLYRALPALDFSKDILEPSCDLLSVLHVPDCGWTDIGTPERLRGLHARQATTRDQRRQALGGV